MAPKSKNYVGITKVHPIYGEYEVIKDLGMIHVRPNGRKDRKLVVKFKHTGYEVETFPDCVVKNQIKDPYYPIIYGVACCGTPKDFDAASKTGIREYNTWCNMISRCYNPKDIMYYAYGEIGVRVDHRWLCFEYFLEDFRRMENYDKWLNGKPREYELDKDLLQLNVPHGHRRYFKDGCCIISKKDNISLKFLQEVKSYTGVVPTGYGTYRAKIYNGTRNVPIDATFNNQFSAAVYHDAYCWMYPSNTSNNIPFNIAEFMEAQNNRLGNGGHPYNGYLRMYTLIDNNTHNKIGG